jgi:alpha-maltose-1-phosphate synthase
MRPASSAFLFHPDAFVVQRVKLMGRHVAGAGFLRAAVQGLRGETIWGAGSDASHRAVFDDLVKACDPLAVTGWLPLQERTRLAAIGALTLPGPGLIEEAALRLKHGHAAYSLIGLTHTTATHAVMGAFADLLAGPAMPWDAIVCTSRAVRDTAQAIMAAQADYLRWRTGAALAPPTPLLPVIPLGVHADDFQFEKDERLAARAALGLADEIAFLFVGRLSFHAKAHPEPLYRALETAAREGRKLALIECGWFANDHIAQAFADGARLACPSVRIIRVDGRNDDARRRCWAAGDVFASLSDNVQETFGLTPIEAMAAGLPCIVTDWNGYRDTVRDGIDGFTIPTAMPGPPLGESLADDYDEQRLNYDHYIGAVAMMVSLDHAALLRAVRLLADDPELRRKMGASAQAQARAVFDWSLVFKAYRALWSELASIRQSHPLAQAPGPRRIASRLDPFLTFRGYPTTIIGPESLVCRSQDNATVLETGRHPLFGAAQFVDPALKEISGAMLDALAPGADETLAGLAARIDVPVGRVVRIASVLLKTGALSLKR